MTLSLFYSYTRANRSNVMTGDFALNATAPRVVLSNGRSVADPFFNVAYPRALKNDVDMLKADDAHLVNLRLAKDLTLAGGRKVTFSADVFNLFNSAPRPASCRPTPDRRTSASGRTTCRRGSASWASA